MLFYQTYREYAEKSAAGLLVETEKFHLKEESGEAVRNTHYLYSPRTRERTLGFHMIRV